MADHQDQCDLHSNPELLDAQRACDAAWAKLQAYRLEVDVARGVRTTADGVARPAQRPWSEDENEKFAKRLAAVRQAAEARTAAMADAGLTSTYEVEKELRLHAREDLAAP